MENIREIIKKLLMLEKAFNIKESNFMFKSYPHQFIYSIGLIDHNHLKVDEYKKAFDNISIDITNGYDGFDCEIVETNEYLTIIGNLC